MIPASVRCAGLARAPLPGRALHGDRPEPWAYLRDLLCLLPSWPKSRALELAPAFWQQTLQQRVIDERSSAEDVGGQALLSVLPLTRVGLSGHDAVHRTDTLKSRRTL